MVRRGHRVRAYGERLVEGASVIIDDLRTKDGFTAVESQIADFFLARQQAIGSLSARAIATDVRTAPSSVVHLCQRLGFQGYQDFSQAWLEELR